MMTPISSLQNVLAVSYLDQVILYFSTITLLEVHFFQ